MDALIAAINAKWVSSALASAVSNRIYFDEALPHADFPYVVWRILTATPEKTFTEHYTDSLVQFSIFSASLSAVEITGIYNALISLYDECSLTITGYTLVWMKQENLVVAPPEDMITESGTQKVKAWHVDFEIKTSLN